MSTTLSVTSSLNASSTAHITGRLSLGENLTFSATSATTTIPSSLRNAFAFATTSAPTPFLTFDTSNYRIGLGTTSPGRMFSVKGNLLANGLNLFGSGTSTISGRLEITGTSTMAGYKICTQENNVCAGGAFSSSGGFTTLRTASDLVGIGTSTPAEKLSINGGAFFDSDVIRYGSSSQPTLLFKYAASSTSTLPNLTSAFTYATSTTNTPLLTLSTKSSRYGRVGIGTSSPSALFAINALNSSNQADNLFYIGSSTQNTFVIDNHGNIGIGTSTRSGSKARLAITGFGTGTNRILALANANNNEVVTVQENGNVGIGTTSPGATLDVQGSLRVGSGSVLGKIQTGQAALGSGVAGRNTYTVTFPSAFVSVPKVSATTKIDPPSETGDGIWPVTINAVTTTSFTVNIIVISTTGAVGGAWSQNLRLNWIAWE